MSALRKAGSRDLLDSKCGSPQVKRTPLSERGNLTPARALFKGDKNIFEKPSAQKKTPRNTPRGADREQKLQQNRQSISKVGSTPKYENRMKTLSERQSGDSSISVAVRVRPFNQRELSHEAENVISMDRNVTLLTENGREHEFAFDHSLCSFDPASDSFVTQEKLFTKIAQPLLKWSFDGYNTCLFAYGQTGSGKSYTMMGFKDEEGVIPRFSQRLFEEINLANNSDNKVQYSTQMSYYEIYNEKIFDLLAENDTRQRLVVREHPDYGPYVQGLAMQSVGSHSALMDWLEVGNKQRATASTGMNEKSSRSHSVFTINLAQITSERFEGSETQLQRSSKINLVDLAGSERSDRVQDFDYRSAELSSTRMKEGSCINKSLHTLGKVISILAEMTNKKNSFIPYRDSVLTWLLKESLGGNAKTTMLATLSPSSEHASESLSTLRYASQARHIVNKAKVNEDTNSQMIRELLAEIKHLKAYQRRSGCTNLRSEIAELRANLSNAQNQLAKTKQNWQDEQAKSSANQSNVARKLRKSGVSFTKLESNQASLVNLNDDPQLAEVLLYVLKQGETSVGKGNGIDAHIQLKSNLIAQNHCKFIVSEDEVYVVPYENATTYVNGDVVHNETALHHGDRLVFGGDLYFRMNKPAEARLLSQSNTQVKDFKFAENELHQKQNKRLEEEISQARLDAEGYAMEMIKEAQEKAKSEIKLQRQHFEEELLALQQRLEFSLEEKQLANSEKENSKQIITQLKSQQKHLEEEIRNNKERLESEAYRARRVFEEAKSNQRQIIEELENQKRKIQTDIEEMKKSKAKTKWRTSIKMPVNQSKGCSIDLLQVEMLIREANEICKSTNTNYIFSRDEFCLKGEVNLQIKVSDTSNSRYATIPLEKLKVEIDALKDQSQDYDGFFSNLQLEWHPESRDKRSTRMSLSDLASASLIKSLNDSMVSGRSNDLSSFAIGENDNTTNGIQKVNASQAPMESSRISYLNNQQETTMVDSSVIRSTFVETVLEEEEDENEEISIISGLMRRIFFIHHAYNNKQAMDDTALMNLACNMKGLKEAASMLCSVHYAVGQTELQNMSLAFKQLVVQICKLFKTQASFDITRETRGEFNSLVAKLVEIAAAFSLSAVDHLNEEQQNNYFPYDSSKELCTYFLDQQNKFLMTMFDEAEYTIQNSVQDVRSLQLNVGHEMREELVDDVMNVLTSTSTLLCRGMDYINVYSDIGLMESTLFNCVECFSLRGVLAAIVDLNETVQQLAEQSQNVAGNSERMDQLIEAPVRLADTTKTLCSVFKRLTTFIVTSKTTLQEEIVQLLNECFMKVEFASKAVRVGATILIQEVERSLDVPEEQSLVSFVQSDVEFKKARQPCPLNRSNLDVPMHGRSAPNNSTRDLFISRYMNSSGLSEQSSYA